MAERKPEEREVQQGGDESWESFEDLAKKIVSVPKEEVDEKRRAMEREREESA